MTRSDDVSRRLGRKVLVGTAWSTVERFGSLGLQFAVNLVLARLLTPAEFAYVGVLAFFMSVSYVLIDGGFATALIQKQNPTRADYSVIFIWNMAFALFFYALLFYNGTADCVVCKHAVAGRYNKSVQFVIASQCVVAGTDNPSAKGTCFRVYGSG